MPTQLSKEYKKFKYSLVNVRGNSPEKADEVPQKILSGDISSYKGAIAENMVASAFATSGMKLYYFHDPTGSPELDFLFEKDGEAVIVECKASNNRATSMKFVISKPTRFGVHPAIKFADTNVGSGEGFSTLPLYAIGFMERPKEKNIVDMVDVSNLKVPTDS